MEVLPGGTCSAETKSHDNNCVSCNQNHYWGQLRLSSDTQHVCDKILEHNR